MQSKGLKFSAFSLLKFSIAKFDEDFKILQRTPILQDMMIPECDLSTDDCKVQTAVEFASELIDTPNLTDDDLKERINAWKKKNSEPITLETQPHKGTKSTTDPALPIPILAPNQSTAPDYKPQEANLKTNWTKIQERVKIIREEFNHINNVNLNNNKNTTNNHHNNENNNNNDNNNHNNENNNENNNNNNNNNDNSMNNNNNEIHFETGDQNPFNNNYYLNSSSTSQQFSEPTSELQKTAHEITSTLFEDNVRDMYRSLRQSFSQFEEGDFHLSENMSNIKQISEPAQLPLELPEPKVLLIDERVDIPTLLTVNFFTKDRKLQSFQMLSTQTLADVQECFFCVGRTPVDCPKIFRDSGVFFIENTVFYNETDDENEWKSLLPSFENQKLPLPKPQTQPMQKRPLSTFFLKIGYPYTFLHLNKCEHYVTFTEVRKMTVDDAQDLSCYPIQVYQSRIARKRCRVCEVFNAKFLTYGDPLSHENPCLFCEWCFQQLHYDEEGKLLYTNFRVFPYFHDL